MVYLLLSGITLEDGARRGTGWREDLPKCVRERETHLTPICTLIFGAYEREREGETGVAKPGIQKKRDIS